jgi:hypothetical protein
MSSPQDVLVEVLRSHSSRVLTERQRDYLLILFSVDNRDVVLCFKKGYYSNVYYAKLGLAESLMSLDCSELEYSPLGLYAFSNSPSQLAEIAIKKARILVARSI